MLAAALVAIDRYAGSKGRPLQLGSSIRKTISTDAGGMFLWDRESFDHVTDHDSWDKEFGGEPHIRRHIEAGRIAPLSWGVDGASEVVVRLGAPSRMSDREKKYLLVPSQPYRFQTSGNACISGVEMISSGPADQVLALNVDPGEYAVHVNMIAWMDEPGAENPDGSPSSTALPDFIVYLDAPKAELNYRSEPEPFRKEDAKR